MLIRRSTALITLLAIFLVLLGGLAYRYYGGEIITYRQTDFAGHIPAESWQANNQSFDAGAQSSPVTSPTTVPLISLPNVIRETKVGNLIIDKKGQAHKNHVYMLTALPNDPDANQWWVPAIGMVEAWGIGRGAIDTVIAVIDTGFSLNHEELVGRWLENQAEKGPATSEAPSMLNCTAQGIPLDMSCNNIDDDFDGIVNNESGPTTRENPSRLNCTDRGLALDKSCNLIDDSGNGLIDDVIGFDFANFDHVVEAGETDPTGEATKHGTMVTGVAVATGNNGVGIAGVDWGAKVLPIQVFTDEGYADTLIVSRAIRYAWEQGADVISLSLGTCDEDSYLRDAISEAITAGSIVVAAAGNRDCGAGSTEMLYPAKFPEVVAVGSSNSSGDRSSFSSFGPSLDLLAPGSSIKTSTWHPSSTNTYATVSGTSLATPLVAGLLSLARSHQPDATWAEITAALLENTDRSLLSSGESFSSSYGFGISDAGGLMARAITPLSFSQVNKFSPLRIYDQLSSVNAYQCQSGQFGGTPLYEMTKSGRYRYTLNQHERGKLLTSSWQSRFLGYACLLIPGDTANTTRLLNMPAEFSNTSLKLVD